MRRSEDKKLNISIFTTKWGHYSIASAVKNALETPANKIFFNEIQMEKVMDKSYMIFYRVFPPLFKLPYKVAEQKELTVVIKKYLNKRYKKLITEIIEKQKPRVVVNTYVAFNWILEDLSQKHNFLYINIVSDPRTINKLLVSKIGYNFVFDTYAKNQCLKFGVNKKKIITSGWFVRKDYLKNHTPSKARGKLGFPQKTFTVAVVGGSAGTYAILKIFPAFIKPPKRLHVVCVCGDNKKLLKGIKFLSEILVQNSLNKNLKITALGFKNNLHEYLQAADLVIGKAGPNLIFESVATKTPFLAISHISGQEDGNLEIIKTGKLGLVEENRFKAVKLIRKIIRNPKMLEGYQKSLEEMAEYNNQAYTVLRKFIEEKTNSI